MKKLARENVKTKIKNQGNKIFSAEFSKTDGTTRKVVARLGVKSHLRGGENKVVRDDRSYMTVFDMQKQEYRTLNLRTIKEIKIDGERYEVI